MLKINKVHVVLLLAYCIQSFLTVLCLFIYALPEIGDYFCRRIKINFPNFLKIYPLYTMEIQLLFQIIMFSSWTNLYLNDMLLNSHHRHFVYTAPVGSLCGWHFYLQDTNTRLYVTYRIHNMYSRYVCTHMHNMYVH